jgi:hypothetical protein
VEDQALWRSAGDVTNLVASTRFTGNALHWKVRNDDLLNRLAAAIQGRPAAAARLAEVRDGLVASQVESHALLTGHWPVDPTRGCQYPQSLLGSAMQASDGRDNRAQLAEARASASRCVDLSRAILAKVQRSNEQLARGIDQAEKALAAELPPPAGR